VFGLGPHTLYKGGYEIHTGAVYEQAGDGEERETELGLELKYGLTADWSVAVEAPFVDLREAGASRSGPGDLAVSTKYRFWRDDMPGAQESAAVAAELITDTGDDEVADGATDTVLGLTYGYEGRRWYRWAAVRYRRNGEADTGLERGDKLLVDLVGGIRPYLGGYREP
ncbi:MAG: transporter, partial [Gammaproteobacteria bacterium]|nr:transporter [Gammaproteobacteria bacterium]NIR84458.1 transporter [Gammaproteobacteria bacterium]NIU05476.1 transporter [Gammaproteobacteria bacterium]NIX86749.1 hypothetical protein [Gammaproteobacteria bacterium]